ncbi:MAG: protein translocase subunit SecF [Pseudomonadota bacterium]
MFKALREKKLEFLKWRGVAMTVSAILILASIALLATRGLNWGLDFTGGILVEVGFPQAADLPALREELQKSGFDDAVVQLFGTEKDVTVRLPAKEGQNAEEIGNAVQRVLADFEPNIDIRRIESVGAAVGEELAEKGSLAMLIALICIMIYVTLRFEWKFALGSVLALIHDVTITLGFFSLFQVDFDLTVLAAILAVIGYSLNDTIVVFDRIRENFRLVRSGTPINIINTSLNQTLSRTLMTSLTTLLVLVALFVLGGAMIHSFAEALIVGVLVGTYSSIYVASSAAISLGVKKEDLVQVQVEKEGADQENLADYF